MFKHLNAFKVVISRFSMDERRYRHVTNALADIDPTQYASINVALEEVGSGIRFGPPVDSSSVIDPKSSRQVGIYHDQKSPLFKAGRDGLTYLEEALQKLGQQIRKSARRG